ncbi:MAG TPA: 16S rRNA (cytidine(1402)-2'-O)-methyltransferase [Patescibacteria group bacterium]|nr:16S rRNA (cytidine(1402)-2'-O)-methyltransferase [Patescibacteria group bacterium]
MNCGILYTIATPIGNLEDITYRAIRILHEVDRIICEDTRETLKLLQNYDITSKRPLLSYHAQSSIFRENEILSYLQKGETIALVADRGTPGISDPGSRLIHRAVAIGATIIPIPGPAAFLAALQASGAATKAFSFLGFLPHKKGRQTILQHALAQADTVVFYESPHRIIKCLEQLIAFGSSDRPIILARELTKKHEEFLRGTAQALLDELKNREAVYGEFVVIIDAQS